MAVPTIKMHLSAELQVDRGQLGFLQRYEGQVSLNSKCFTASKNIKYI